MTRQELRAIVDDRFCGCGDHAAAYRTLLQLLRLQDPEHWSEQDTLIPDPGVLMLLLYWLDHLGWTEHGTSIRAGWLTQLGKEILQALELEESDNFKELQAP